MGNMYKTIIAKVQDQHPVIVERTPNCGFQDGPSVFFKSEITGRECQVSYAGDSWWYIDTPVIGMDYFGGTELFSSGITTDEVARDVVKAIGRA